MSKYACNSEGVRLLNGMSTSLTNAIKTMTNATKDVHKVADDNKSYLGPHVNSFYKALSDIDAAIKKASEPTKEVAQKLKEVANKYQNIIDDDPFA